MKRDIEANMTLVCRIPRDISRFLSSYHQSAAAKRAALANLEVDGTKLEDLALDFTLPGYDIELRVGQFPFSL